MLGLPSMDSFSSLGEGFSSKRPKSSGNLNLTPMERRQAKNRLYGVEKRSEIEDFVQDNPEFLLRNQSFKSKK